MTAVLVSGDDFIAPELFSAALSESLPSAGLSFRTLRTRWPNEPFGPVGADGPGNGGVKEASGTEEQVLEALGDASVALTQMAPFTSRVIRESPHLKFIGVARGGPVNVDLAAATAAGIPVTFTPGRNAAAAAEFTIGLMLAAMRHLTFADAALKEGTWRGDYYAYENAGWSSTEPPSDSSGTGPSARSWPVCCVPSAHTSWSPIRTRTRPGRGPTVSSSPPWTTCCGAAPS